MTPTRLEELRKLCHGQGWYDKIGMEMIAEIDRLGRYTVAAPDLLAALTELYTDTASYIQVNKLGDIHHNQAMKMARAALDKARGTE